MSLVVRLRDYCDYWYHQSTMFYESLSRPKQIAIMVLLCIAPIAGILFLVYHKQIFLLLAELAKVLKDMPFFLGSIIIIAGVIIVSIPPLIGYSALASLSGMMYGFPGAWPILAVSTIIGSTLSFTVFRYLFLARAIKLAQSSSKFAALTKTLSESGSFKLLIMIRLCPLPYSLSNGALASVPSVSAAKFALATLLTSPKLLMHCFVGDRIARLGTETVGASKWVDTVGIVITMVIGSITAWVVYQRVEKIEREMGVSEDLETGSYTELNSPRDNNDEVRRLNMMDEFEISSDEEELNYDNGTNEHELSYLNMDQDNDADTFNTYSRPT
ncbi:hypothetical protein NADFUDRAFT_47706 [Nadsonia fulvescens var. elongata DSM 6958]|uniref:Golgi apparatus membrane protein TVP38 n=1 Tax=Nadsonia fulvescens var. elongata DSM 6958 TaxID=857566 RepID=A0A1E3PF23_9ASCO|nr:hypothetical protein NADFUDRAFT_47706 [Nadsonia fulvescens var. elongata DSM 6958]